MIKNADTLQAFLARGGKFCLSDDSHGVEQVALNYHQLHSFMQDAGIQKLHYLVHTEEKHSRPFREEFPNCVLGAATVEELSTHAFWSS